MPGRVHLQAEHRRAVHTPPTAAAREPGEGRVLEHVAVEYQGDAQRHYREGYSAQAQRRQPHDDAERERRQNSDRDGDETAGVVGRDHHSRRVGADSREGRLAQGDLADIAREQDEAEDPESPHDCQRCIELESHVQSGRQPGQHREGEQRQQDADREAGRPGHLVTAVSPRGFRTISTARMTTRATSRGKPIDWIQIVGYVSSRPRMKPPSTVSGDQTIPPMSAAASASMMSSGRLVVSKVMKGGIRNPATAAMRLPSIQLTALTLPTGTAHSEAAVGLSDTARIDLPKPVYRRKAANPKARPSATTMMAIEFAPTGTSAMLTTQSFGMT